MGTNKACRSVSQSHLAHFRWLLQLSFPCGPIHGMQSPQLQGGSALGTGNTQKASHFSGGSARSPWAASVPQPGPRHQAGMGAGHPRAGKDQLVIRGAAHSPCPPNPRQMCWVWMRWGAAAFVSRRFPCKPREQRAWGEGVTACLAAGSSRTRVPDKQPYHEAREGSTHTYRDLAHFQEMAQ